MSAGLDSLSDAGVTVKYVILDDGWQSTALTGKGRDNKEKAEKNEKIERIERIEKVAIEEDGRNNREDLELGPGSGPGSALLQSDLLLLDSDGRLSRQLTEPSTSTSFSLSTSTSSSSLSTSSSSTSLSGTALPSVPVPISTLGEDGELSGAQIDGNLAAQKMLEKESSPVIAFLTTVYYYCCYLCCYYYYHCYCYQYYYQLLLLFLCLSIIIIAVTTLLFLYDMSIYTPLSLLYIIAFILSLICMILHCFL